MSGNRLRLEVESIEVAEMSHLAFDDILGFEENNNFYYYMLNAQSMQ